MYFSAPYTKSRLMTQRMRWSTRQNEAEQRAERGGTECCFPQGGLYGDPVATPSKVKKTSKKLRSFIKSKEGVFLKDQLAS